MTGDQIEIRVLLFDGKDYHPAPLDKQGRVIIPDWAVARKVNRPWWHFDPKDADLTGYAQAERNNRDC